ncbi:MAG TPA: DUF4097 family beta strand repeat-containing protein [Candidatus Didemnitutus sp.]|nr:DUF4097 family beta strand repeat-containing protein [Candidatus Didemnitutus sp.]
MKMITRFLALALAVSLPAVLSAKIQRTVEKTFTVQPGGLLKALTQGGDVRIKTADTTEMHIVARETIHASDDAEADKLLEDLKLTFEQTGNEVTVEAKYDRSSGFHFGSWPPVQVSFEVTVPKAFNLDLKTSGGDIAVASLKGNVKAHTSGGELKFERIDGEIDAGTSGGDIELQEGTARARLSTSGGNIKVERAGGPTEVSTSGGDIRLDSVAELIGASTSGGNVKANITGPIKRDTVLSTSGGDVHVTVAKGTAFELDASTSGGEVKASGLTLTIEKGGVGKSRLAGAVNGGGSTLKLRSSGGDITIESE